MSRNSPSSPFEPPVYTADTVVEITSTGAIDPLLNVPQRNQVKLGTVLMANAEGLCRTAFDPAQRGKFFEHLGALEEVGDAFIGATDLVEETSLPYCAEKVVPAGEALLKHRGLVTELCPTTAVLRWDSLATAVRFTKTIEAREEDLERRRENLAIVKAHVLTFIDDEVTKAADLSASTTKHHRGLRIALEPVTDLISGAAEQGQKTRQIVARRHGPVLRALAGAAAWVAGAAGSTCGGTSERSPA